MADYKIKDQAIMFKLSSAMNLFVALFGVLACGIIAYFSALPLVNGSHPVMPRTFFVGLTVAGGGFAIMLIYALLHHCEKIKIDFATGRVFEKWRSFGGASEYNRALSKDAYITVEKQQKYYKATEDVGHKLRNVCDIVFYNAPYKAQKIHSGIVPEEADEIIAFFEQNGVEQRKVKTSMNPWVLGGTLIFMAALFFELYKMGALS